MSDPFLVAGLGNPGDRYRHNRHNLGFLTLDRLVVQNAVPWKKRFEGLSARCRIHELDLVLLKPQTYMNLSGRSIQKAATFFGVPSERVLVVHDDLDISFGEVRIKDGGGAGGHHGLESIIESLGTDRFLRIRIGVGRPGSDTATDYVLADFTSEERARIDPLLDAACNALIDTLRLGPKAAMNRHHGRLVTI